MGNKSGKEKVRASSLHECFEPLFAVLECYTIHLIMDLDLFSHLWYFGGFYLFHYHHVCYQLQSQMLSWKWEIRTERR